ncbi:hypothetical protein ACFLY4_02285 [Chloroflexota bacterium]
MMLANSKSEHGGLYNRIASPTLGVVVPRGNRSGIGELGVGIRVTFTLLPYTRQSILLAHLERGGLYFVSLKGVEKNDESPHP